MALAHALFIGWRKRQPCKRLASCLECATNWGDALVLLKFWLEHKVRY